MRHRNFNKFQKNNEATLLVIGLGRGGTSLVSGALHHMGIFMGEAARPPNFEDRANLDILLSRDIEKATKLRNKYNKHSFWGIKYPGANLRLISRYQRFRNPVVLSIRKPIKEIAKRRTKTRQHPFISSYLLALTQRKLIDLFLFIKKPPMIELTYSSMIDDPLSQLTQLAQYLNIDNLDVDAGVSFISHGKDEYELWVNRTISNYIGNINKPKDRIIAGWVFHKNESEPVELKVYSSGVCIATAVADRKRRDVQTCYKDRYIHISENSGFRIKLNEIIDKSQIELYAKTKDGLEKLYLGGQASTPQV